MKRSKPVVAVVFARLTAVESMINSHIYAPSCQPFLYLPAVCSCARSNGCGQQLGGPASPAAVYDTPFTYSCAGGGGTITR